MSNIKRNIEEEFKNNFCTYGSHSFIWKPETSPQKVLEWIKAIQVQAKVKVNFAEDTKQKLIWLDNLLCTIYRDGGHFIEENGYQKAYDNAMDKIINWLSIS